MSAHYYDVRNSVGALVGESLDLSEALACADEYPGASLHLEQSSRPLNLESIRAQRDRARRQGGRS